MKKNLYFQYPAYVSIRIFLRAASLLSGKSSRG